MLKFVLLIIFHIAMLSFIQTLKLSNAHAFKGTKVDHHILIYTAENNNLESSSFVDFAKLTSRPLQDNICVHQLMDTHKMGHYKIKICGDPYEGMKITRIPQQNMSSTRVLEHFIRESMKEVPAEKYSLIFQGHGFSHILKTEEQSNLFVSDIRKVLQRVGIKMYFISLDMCLMSTLETLYELQDVTHYIVANEDYCPWDGLISTNFLTLFEHEKSETKLIQKIARLSLAQNAKIEDSADLTVIQTDGIRDLAHLVKSFRLEPQDFQDAFLIDPNEKDFEFDLYELVINHPNLSESQKAEFHMKFLKTVVFYGTNKSKQATGRPTHGISILKTRNYTGFNSIQRAALDQLEFHQDDI